MALLDKTLRRMCVSAHVLTLTATTHWLRALIWQMRREKPAWPAVLGTGVLPVCQQKTVESSWLRAALAPVCAFQHHCTFLLEWLLIILTQSLMKLMLHMWIEMHWCLDTGARGQCLELLCIIVFVWS